MLMLVDASVLLHAVDDTGPFNASAVVRLEEVLNGPWRVGMAVPTFMAFLRITTHPRALAQPMTPTSAWGYVEDWLACDNVWIPAPTERHANVLAGLLFAYHLRGNLIADADLAALAIERGLSIRSADTDLARFREIRWVNPIATSWWARAQLRGTLDRQRPPSRGLNRALDSVPGQPPSARFACSNSAWLISPRARRVRRTSSPSSSSSRRRGPRTALVPRVITKNRATTKPKKSVRPLIQAARESTASTSGDLGR
jgi:toxin-antitoxin system PIN domain toxin